MMVLVTYDVNTETKESRKRLRHVAKLCENYGQRVQNSVFECLLDPDQWAKVKLRLLDEYDPDADSLRFYYLGANFKSRIEHFGAKKVLDPEAPLVL